MHNIFVIIKKQLRDTLKNKTILIQFIMFPLMTIVMENAVNIDGMPEHFFTKLFAVMYIGMAPFMSMGLTSSERPFFLLVMGVGFIISIIDSIKKFSTVVFTQQIKILFDGMSFSQISDTGVSVTAGSALVLCLLFFLAYRKKGLE